MRALRIVLVCAALAVVATPGSGAPVYSIEIDPSPGETLTAIISGPAASVPSGEFRGRVSLYEAAHRGRWRWTTKRGGVLRITMRIRYADLPEEWGKRVRPDGFEFRLRGVVAGAPVDWRGRSLGRRHRLRGGERGGRFVSLRDVEMTSLSPAGSHGVARISVVNPFTFPLRIASSDYQVEASGQAIGRGATRGPAPARAALVHARFSVELTTRSSSPPPAAHF